MAGKIDLKYYGITLFPVTDKGFGAVAECPLAMKLEMNETVRKCKLV